VFRFFSVRVVHILQWLCDVRSSDFINRQRFITL